MNTTRNTSVLPEKGLSSEEKVQPKKGLEKFGKNRFGILNSKGEEVSEDYLRRYIHCWCRVSDGFVHNRKANIAYFMSDEFLAQHSGKTASQVGKAASIDPRWKVAQRVDTGDELEDATPGMVI